MLKLLIYDLDGTLVDTREDIALSANHMLAQMDLPQLAHEEIATYVGRGVHHLISNCLKSQEAKKIERGISIYRKYYAEHMLDHSRLYPGVEEILEAFKDQNQVVLTNKPNPFSQEMLEALQVAQYFRRIIAGNSEYPKKPDPAAVQAMMKLFGASQKETLFVGDSLVDIETARNAGVQIAVVTHGFSNKAELQSAAPEYLADDFYELLRIIKSQNLKIENNKRVL